MIDTPPTAAEVAHLRPRDAVGAAYTALCLLMTATGIALTQTSSLFPSAGVAFGWIGWVIGNGMLAIALLQWFVLLHECGHGLLFRRRALNRAIGHLAGFFSTIPFRSWQPIHRMHHKWTGWQDLDPTTASLVPRPLGTAERFVMNTCWRYWIPAFSVLYRVSNFWNLPRLGKLRPKEVRGIIVNAALLAICYLAIIVIVGPITLLVAIGPGVVLSLMMIDPIMMSQHTHIPLNNSGGESVKAFGAQDQQVFTRSLRFPAWFSSAILLHFDAHELHHMYPFVPGYDLRKIRYETVNEAHWWTWIRKARAMKAERFLFENRDGTGSDV